MSIVDVLVGNYTIIDFELFDLWVNGLSVTECVSVLQHRGALQSTGAGFDELLSDVKDHFRLFIGLENLLICPPKFGEQTLYQIDMDTQFNLIQKYYQFDDVMVREILGKKLSTKTRNNLDDVYDKTRIALRSCRRQFDNVKRVFKMVEDMPGSLERNIKTHFRLSDELAMKYASIVFMANHRFETGKKKLNQLTFDDFMFCSFHMIANWSYSAVDCDDHEDMDVDLDRKFLHDLRDLKQVMDKDSVDEHKMYVVNCLNPKLSIKKLAEVEDNFKVFSKSIVNIAYGLNHSKEAKNFFIDVTEKVIEPCMTNNWTFDEMKTFLLTYKDACRRLSVFRTNPNLVTVWERYMNTFIHCTMRMYHS